MFSDPTNIEIDYKKEEEFANKIKEILSNNFYLNCFINKLDNIFNETRNFISLKQVPVNFIDMFINMEKPEIIYVANQFKYFNTLIIKNFEKSLNTVILYRYPTLNYKEYFFLFSML